MKPTTYCVVFAVCIAVLGSVLEAMEITPHWQAIGTAWAVMSVINAIEWLGDQFRNR